MKTSVIADMEVCLIDLAELSDKQKDSDAKRFFATAYANVELWQRKIEQVMNALGIEKAARKNK